MCVCWEEARVVEERTKEHSLNHLNKAKAYSTGISRTSSKLSEILTFQVSNELLTIWPLTFDAKLAIIVNAVWIWFSMWTSYDM